MNLSILRLIDYRLMAKIKNGKVSGIVGTEVFGKVGLFVRKGQQQMRAASSTANDPQSAGQMYQRLKMLTTAPLYNALKEAIALGREIIPEGQSLYNRFTADAMRAVPFGITKELHAKGAGIAWGAQITLGSLPSIAVDDKHITDIKLQGLASITPATTVGQLADAIVNGNPGRINYDDEIAFIEVLQSVDPDGTPKISCTRAAVELHQNDKTPLSTLVSLKGFSVRSGYLAMNGTPAVGAFAWVHSRTTEDGVKVSSQQLITNNDFILGKYGAPAQLRLAAKSLGANLFSEKFLKPTTALSRKALRAFDISTLATKGAQGTVAAPILGIEYQDVAMFANEEAPEIDLNVGKDVKIVLADVSKFDIQDIEVSVNGKACTGVSVSENVISATMPDALDGETMKSILVSDGLNNASFRFQA